MISEKSAILFCQRARINIRYCRPEDTEAIKNLFRLCFVEGDGSPARGCLEARLKSYPLLVAYLAFLVFSLSFYFLSGTLAITGLFCMLIDAAYILISAYSSISFFITLVSGNLRDDLRDPAGHYGIVKNGADEYMPSGIKAFWVAESVSSTTGKTEIVGAVGLDLLSSHKVAGIGEVRRMVVSPYHRRLGIAATLMEACESRAKACGLSRIVLTTSVHHLSAMSLYERVGYKVYNKRDLSIGWSTIKLLDYGKDLVQPSK